VLRTLDADFASTLRLPPAGTPGVIHLKIHPPQEEAVRDKIQKALALLKGTPLAGCIAVSRGEFDELHNPGTRQRVRNCASPISEARDLGFHFGR